MFVFGILFIVAGGVALLVAFSRKNLAEAMTAKETVPIASLEEGAHVELKGRIECDTPVRPSMTKIPCVYFKYRSERLVRDTSEDADRPSERWQHVESGEMYGKFSLNDGTGAVRVNAKGAKFDTEKILDRRFAAGTRLIISGDVVGLLNLPPKLSEDHKLEIHGIPAERELYILGNVCRGPDGALEIAKGEDEFFISPKSEDELVAALDKQMLVLIWGGALAMMIGAVMVIAKLING